MPDSVFDEGEANIAIVKLFYRTTVEARVQNLVLLSLIVNIYLNKVLPPMVIVLMVYVTRFCENSIISMHIFHPPSAFIRRSYIY